MSFRYLDNETLRKLQLVELELLQEVDRICKKCDIHYAIIAGTLLGAVRHGGFIPWDDDADVALLRPEYEKFRKACMTELDTEKFYFQDHRYTPGYRWGYGKLRKMGTVLLKEHQDHMPYEQGVYIDVFPLDDVPENYIKRIFHNFHCFCIRKVLWSTLGKYANPNPIIRKWYSLLGKIPEQKVFNYLQRFWERGNRENSKWVRILTFPTPNKSYGYLKRWYAECEDIEFEKIKFPGIKDYDEYLSFKFGDYMTFPPEEERKRRPIGEIVL